MVYVNESPTGISSHVYFDKKILYGLRSNFQTEYTAIYLHLFHFEAWAQNVHQTIDGVRNKANAITQDSEEDNVPTTCIWQNCVRHFAALSTNSFVYFKMIPTLIWIESDVVLNCVLCVYRRKNYLFCLNLYMESMSWMCRCILNSLLYTGIPIHAGIFLSLSLSFPMYYAWIVIRSHIF